MPITSVQQAIDVRGTVHLMSDEVVSPCDIKLSAIEPVDIFDLDRSPAKIK
jgi:hypothetical protein